MRFTPFAPLLLLLLLLLIIPSLPSAAAQNALVVADRGVFTVFPDRLTFNAQIRSSAPVEQIVLEYGVDKRTCGEITAKAFPKFTPGANLDVNWTWDMLQTGSEPPGAVIWYRWRVTDSAGNSAVSEEKRVTWLDTTYPWQSISRGDLTLYWYAGSRAFAEDLLNTAVAGVERLGALTGVKPQSPISLYIYANTTHMQEAILYEPGWTGGVAFPENNITIIGISPEYLEWGKRTIVHELTHLIVGQMTFSCGRSVPTWLDEGIAVYAEGGLDDWSAAAFQSAIAANTLLPVRAISSGFSEHPDVADLSYSQSYSLVNYLISVYGQSRLLALFGALRDGMSVDQGLQQVYDFGVDELESRWRVWLGARPRPGAAAAPTARPTVIPTFPPVAVAPTGPPRAPTPTVLATPTLVAATPAAAAAGGAAETPPAPPPAGAAPLSPLDPRLVGAALVFLLGLGLAGLSVWKLFGGR